MIVFKHPIAAYIVLMSTTDTEDFALIGDEGSAKLWNHKVVEEDHFFTGLFVHVVEMNVLGSPLKIVDKLSCTVAFLQNEGVVEKLGKFTEYIHVSVISNTA